PNPLPIVASSHRVSPLSSTYHPPLILHSFPTRRSSDLSDGAGPKRRHGESKRSSRRTNSLMTCSSHSTILSISPMTSPDSARYRSEEHTSELQSHLNLVCRLLLEKKKKNNEHRIRQTET